MEPRPGRNHHRAAAPRHAPERTGRTHQPALGSATGSDEPGRGWRMAAEKPAGKAAVELYAAGGQGRLKPQNGVERSDTHRQVSLRSRRAMLNSSYAPDYPAHTLSSACSRVATVRSILPSLSKPNRPRRKVWKSAGSSHCSGTPAAICRPWAANLLPFLMLASVV